jgi:hypothetical protein
MQEEQEWYELSKRSLARAYSDDEPDYPVGSSEPQRDSEG